MEPSSNKAFFNEENVATGRWVKQSFCSWSYRLDSNTQYDDHSRPPSSHVRPLLSLAQILTMSSDEEVAYAAIAAIAQAKAGQYCLRAGEKGNDASKETGQAIGTDAKTLAGMLVSEEKTVLNDLRMQLMSEVNLY